MRLLSIVGARPQFIKLAPLATAFQAAGHEHIIVHTGQHYDVGMSEVFFADLRIPEPDVNLGVGSDSHAAQTAAMLVGLEREIAAVEPTWAIVYGDTNSTLAGALAAVKIHTPLAHVEAGLRSFNRRMPEEHNRVASDHLADLLLAPSRVALENLRREGLEARSELVGDVMIDVLTRVRAAVEAEEPPLPAPVRDLTDFVLATIHRAENTDKPARLAAIVASLAALDIPVVLSVHPRLAARAAEHGLELAYGAIRPVEPLAYPALVASVLRARGVITDSGGLQKEAHALGTPCTTLRSETEWLETLEGGWNVLAADVASLADVVMRPPPDQPPTAPYGDGQASERIVALLEEHARAAI
ncbi:MAG: UDP-N-acetylglucosamine 2-epimerase (non-hydrolyzing) [Actinobacteria bacterium]|nr:UDP-N-acetylglucosamine 2-epimerase (non-hydrolyzing) [Actinomycetota bacterium]